MITASQKKKENIAEYLLYMWQIEDLIRAHKLDLQAIESNLSHFYGELSEEDRKRVLDWYDSLIDMMRREDVAKQGHLQLNKNVIIQLEDLHRRLMADDKYADYNAEYYKTLPYIVELRAKAGDNKQDELETCFTALYGIALLRMQGKEVSPETLAAAKQISHFLALLSSYYRKDAEGKLFDNDLDKE